MKAPLVCSFLLICILANAQYTPVTPLTNKRLQQQEEQDSSEQKKGFDRERLIFGGNIGASFGDYTFVNLTPQVGYMFNRFVTAGVGVNYLYQSVKYYDNAGNDFARNNLSYAGMNVFTRLFPVRFLFVSAQPELNYSWGKLKYKGMYGDRMDEKLTGKFVPAFLVGAGAVLSPSGKGGMFISLQYDVIQNERSPYGTRPYLNIGFGF
ncbi:MAG: hypothetical protein V4717_16970 [Bacteroidota bacterium]